MLKRFVQLWMISLWMISGLNVSFAQSTVMEVETYLTQLAHIPNAERQFVDVRTPAEYSAGTIMDAVNIDVLAPAFSTSIATLDRSKPAYLFCRSGNRSQKAVEMMIEMGFTEVYDLQDGYQAWQFFNSHQAKLK